MLVPWDTHIAGPKFHVVHLWGYPSRGRSFRSQRIWRFYDGQPDAHVVCTKRTGVGCEMGNYPGIIRL